MKTRLHVIISGKVQGVWFRANTKDKAETLDVTGWVRNTSDGKVEAIFEGDEKQLEKILDWCHQGPPLAQVDNVKIEKQKPSNEFKHFSIR